LKDQSHCADHRFQFVGAAINHFENRRSKRLSQTTRRHSNSWPKLGKNLPSSANSILNPSQKPKRQRRAGGEFEKNNRKPWLTRLARQSGPTLFPI
jgi:hypothetical protein